MRFEAAAGEAAPQPTCLPAITLILVLFPHFHNQQVVPWVQQSTHVAPKQVLFAPSPCIQRALPLRSGGLNHAGVEDGQRQRRQNTVSTTQSGGRERHPPPSVRIGYLAQASQPMQTSPKAFYAPRGPTRELRELWSACHPPSRQQFRRQKRRNEPTNDPRSPRKF